MTESKAETQSQAGSLAAVSDAQLFRYVTHKNLVETARVMKRRARQLRPSVSTWLRYVWHERKCGREASAELTRRVCPPAGTHPEPKRANHDQS